MIIDIYMSITIDTMVGCGIENIDCELEGCLINNDIMVYLHSLEFSNIIFIQS